MKITSIKQQIRQQGRYSIFLEGKYAFSLSDSALLESKLVPGQELSPDEVSAFKQISVNDKLYNNTLRFIALRPRSKWEIETYLQRKKASTSLTESILNKLSKVDLINDQKFAQAFVDNRRLLHPSSRRKLTLELRRKNVDKDIIQEVVGNEPDEEHSALADIIARKRRQTRYQDDLKLMQYLARQGFSYGDIKAALQATQID